MRLNQSKCHFLISGNTLEYLWARVGEQLIWESPQHKLLGLTIDSRLRFLEHVELLCATCMKLHGWLKHLIRHPYAGPNRSTLNAAYKAFVLSRIDYHGVSNKPPP